MLGGVVYRRRMSIIFPILVSVITLHTLVERCSSQNLETERPVEFWPLGDWNCSGAPKLCAVDDASQTFQTASVSECSAFCWLNLDRCLRFNYYDEDQTENPLNCHHFHFQPKRYAPDNCQHYVVSVSHIGWPNNSNPTIQ